ERQLERRTPADGRAGRTRPGEEDRRHHQGAEIVTGPPEAQGGPDSGPRYQACQPQARDTDGGTGQRPHGCRDADERAHTEEIVERWVLAGLAPEEIGGDRRFGSVAAGNASSGEDRNARQIGRASCRERVARSG